MTAEEVIEKLDLKQLPDEGGYFRQTYKSNDPGRPARDYGIDSNSLRHFSTAIYYLVTPDSFSALHKVKSDEIFHFYSGDPVEMLQLDDSGKTSRHIIGNNIMAGHQPQVVAPKGIWQGTRLIEGGKWALLGTTVAPGFEFEDFQLGVRDQLIKAIPQHRDDIIRFTREQNVASE